MFMYLFKFNVDYGLHIHVTLFFQLLTTSNWIIFCRSRTSVCQPAPIAKFTQTQLGWSLPIAMVQIMSSASPHLLWIVLHQTVLEPLLQMATVLAFHFPIPQVLSVFRMKTDSLRMHRPATLIACIRCLSLPDPWATLKVTLCSIPFSIPRPVTRLTFTVTLSNHGHDNTPLPRMISSDAFAQRRRVWMPCSECTSERWYLGIDRFLPGFAILRRTSRTVHSVNRVQCLTGPSLRTCHCDWIRPLESACATLHCPSVLPYETLNSCR